MIETTDPSLLIQEMTLALQKEFPGTPFVLCTLDKTTRSTPSMGWSEHFPNFLERVHFLSQMVTVCISQLVALQKVLSDQQLMQEAQAATKQ